MRNEKYQERASNARFCPCPASIVGGDLCLIGISKLPGVALESYNAASGGAVFRFSGTYELEVVAATTVSPLAGAEIENGDLIYATGTVDGDTGVEYDLTLSKDSSGEKVGTYDSPTPLTSGTTATVPVRLREVGL